jgi:hypothetical protein
VKGPSNGIYFHHLEAEAEEIVPTPTACSVRWVKHNLYMLNNIMNCIIKSSLEIECKSAVSLEKNYP